MTEEIERDFLKIYLYIWRDTSRFQDISREKVEGVWSENDQVRILNSPEDADLGLHFVTLHHMLYSVNARERKRAPRPQHLRDMFQTARSTPDILRLLNG